MGIVMLVEDKERDGPQIKQWIVTEIPGVQVLWFQRTQDAEKKLKEFNKTPGVVGCIVLDMYFPDFTGKPDAQGVHIMDEYPDIPIVLISDREESRAYPQIRADVPLLQLDKPVNWTDRLKLQEFRRDLIKAVRCALLVGSLRAEVKRLSGKKVLSPFKDIRTFQAAVLFLICVTVYAISIFYLSEFFQHLFLALSAVMGVHLLDRAILIKDFRDAFESVRQQIIDVSVEVQRIGQEDSDRPKTSDGQDTES